MTNDSANTLGSLVLPYALLGVKKWKETSSNPRTQARISKELEGRIADDEPMANHAVTRPFHPSSDDCSKLILVPMPCKRRGMTGAFFTPVSSSVAEPSFDLVVMMTKGSIAFRFEPADVEGRAHGYDHVQLSRSIGRRSLALPGSLDWLPDSYPAFLIPGQSLASRFLAMVVAMHGYPRGARDILDEALTPNGKMLWQEYSGLIDRMLGV